MKRWKMVLVGCAAAALAVPLLGVGAVFALFPKSVPPSDLRVERSEARVRRGEYLFKHVADCEGCHSHRDVGRFGLPVHGPPGQGFGIGERVVPFPAEGLEGLYVPNITPHREHGIGAWTDGEILRAMREGVSRDGRPLFMAMPYGAFRAMDDADAHAIVAYLRTLQPVATAVPRSSVGFPLVVIQRFAPRPVEAPVRAPPRTDRVAYGAYLAEIASCNECHTLRDGADRRPGMLLAGGVEFRTQWFTVRTPNLTPDRETGLSMDEERFLGRFAAYRDMAAGRDEIPRAPRGQNTVMPWLAFAGMEEDDLRAIYAYLRSVPAVRHRVETGLRP